MQKLPSLMEFQQDHLKGKMMLEVCFNWQGIMHHTFIPEGATVSKER
jgi:hypothetical protein